MEVITLAGNLITDSEVCTDKNGHNFSRFKVSCRSTDYAGNFKSTVYRCFSYASGCERLKVGDQVFITGTLNIGIHTDEKGKTWLNADVFVQHFTNGTPNSKAYKNTKR